MKARDFMTGSLLTCSPEDSVADVAKLMRDRDTGDILITGDGKLMGIVTDRDIAVRVAAKGRNPVEVPIRDYMSKHVVTGEPRWDIDKIAKTMGKHQIRRLPILENGMLVGIVSLGDLALRHNRQSDIVKSLKMISEPGPVHRIRSRGGGRALMTLGMGLLVGTVVALTMSPKQRNSILDQVRDTEIGDKLGSASERLIGTLQEGGDRIAEMLAA
ncbi:MAG: CBS domain-containing protein [Acidobacteriota bacterium]